MMQSGRNNRKLYIRIPGRLKAAGRTEKSKLAKVSGSNPIQCLGKRWEAIWET